MADTTTSLAAADVGVAVPPDTTHTGQDHFRAEVRRFIAEITPENWRGIGELHGEDYEQFTNRVRAALAAKGWLAPTLPQAYGGAGLGPAEHVVLAEELTASGIPFGSDNDAFGLAMLANTMMRHSKVELLERFLPRIVSGEYVFAQGFSEPGAGSDLAAVALRAELSDGRWILNGQKLWSSGAHQANWMFVLARTDPASAPHRGISMLLVPLDQPGVDIRPIRNLTGDTDFNEVFFDDAVTDSELVVGEINQGWTVAMTLLGFERGERALYVPAQMRAELDRLIALVHDKQRHHDPDIRRRIAWCHVQVEQLRCHGRRIAEQLREGKAPGPEAAPFKLLWSEYHKMATELALDVLGVEALSPTGRPSPNWYGTDDPGAPNSSASWASVYLNSRAGTIYAGTSQVQRGIIGELILGLPKESRPA